MVTIHRERGLRFVIYTMDHEPVHIHVFGDGEMKVEIRGRDGWPEIVWSIGTKGGERRRAMDIVLARQTEFLARWREIHGETS